MDDFLEGVINRKRNPKPKSKPKPEATTTTSQQQLTGFSDSESEEEQIFEIKKKSKTTETEPKQPKLEQKTIIKAIPNPSPEKSTTISKKRTIIDVSEDESESEIEKQAEKKFKLQPYTLKTHTIKLLNIKDCKQLSVIDWDDNSCYMDSVIFALFVVNANYIWKNYLLPYLNKIGEDQYRLNADAFDLKNRKLFSNIKCEKDEGFLEIADGFIELFASLHNPKRTKQVTCSNFRRLFTKDYINACYVDNITKQFQKRNTGGSLFGSPKNVCDVFFSVFAKPLYNIAIQEVILNNEGKIDSVVNQKRKTYYTPVDRSGNLFDYYTKFAKNLGITDTNPLSVSQIFTDFITIKQDKTNNAKKYSFIETDTTEFVPLYVTSTDAYKKELVPSFALTNSQKLLINSFIYYKKSHYITFFICGTAWYVYDGMDSKEKIKLVPNQDPKKSDIENFEALLNSNIYQFKTFNPVIYIYTTEDFLLKENKSAIISPEQQQQLQLQNYAQIEIPTISILEQNCTKLPVFDFDKNSCFLDSTMFSLFVVLPNWFKDKILSNFLITNKNKKDLYYLDKSKFEKLNACDKDTRYKLARSILDIFRNVIKSYQTDSKDRKPQSCVAFRTFFNPTTKENNLSKCFANETAVWSTGQFGIAENVIYVFLKTFSQHFSHMKYTTSFEIYDTTNNNTILDTSKQSFKSGFKEELDLGDIILVFETDELNKGSYNTLAKKTLDSQLMLDFRITSLNKETIQESIKDRVYNDFKRQLYGYIVHKDKNYKVKKQERKSKAYTDITALTDQQLIQKLQENGIISSVQDIKDAIKNFDNTRFKGTPYEGLQNESQIKLERKQIDDADYIIIVTPRPPEKKYKFKPLSQITLTNGKVLHLSNMIYNSGDHFVVIFLCGNQWYKFDDTGPSGKKIELLQGQNKNADKSNNLEAIIKRNPNSLDILQKNVVQMFVEEKYLLKESFLQQKQQTQLVTSPTFEEKQPKPKPKYSPEKPKPQPTLTTSTFLTPIKAITEEKFTAFESDINQVYKFLADQATEFNEKVIRPIKNNSNIQFNPRTNEFVGTLNNTKRIDPEIFEKIRNNFVTLNNIWAEQSVYTWPPIYKKTIDTFNRDYPLYDKITLKLIVDNDNLPE